MASPAAVVLSQAQPRRVAARPLWAYWHLLSLDAPTVAAVWCCAFAQAARVRVPLACVLALGGTVWMLYAADRLLDARTGHSRPQLRERHWFHAAHRSALLPVLAMVAALVAAAAWLAIPRSVLLGEASLAVAAAVYFVRVHLGPHLGPHLETQLGTHLAKRFGWRRLATGTKESAVGIIFALGVAIPAMAMLAHPWPLLLPTAAFAALCGLNCLLIEKAEAARPTAACNWVLALLAVASLLAMSGGFRLLWLEICLAAGLLLAASLAKARLSPLAFRVAADAALLTPLLAWPWTR